MPRDNHCILCSDFFMSFLSLGANASPRTNPAEPLHFPFWLSVSIGFCFSLVLCLPSLPHLWQTGFVRDPDDAMRLVMLHQWLWGHEWYNETLLRFNPPEGVHMHWSHVIDLPLAFLFKLFSLFCHEDQAELLMRISYPALLQIGTLAVGQKLSDALFGSSMRLVSSCALALSGSFLGQFALGRVDHHSAQILLLMIMCTLMIHIISTHRRGVAWALSLVIALSLAISVENMPFIIVNVACVPLIWAWKGERYRHTLAHMGASSLILTPFIFTLFYDPHFWREPHVDAMSIAHVCAFMVGGLGLLILSVRHLNTGIQRCIGLMIVGIVWLVIMKLSFPDLLGDPYKGLDPLVRRYWLDHVTEVRNIFQYYASEGTLAFNLFTPLTLSSIIFAIHGFKHRDARFLYLAALSVSGLVVALIMIRAVSFIAALDAMAAPLIAAHYLPYLMRMNAPFITRIGLHEEPVRIGSHFITIFLLSPIMWVALMPQYGVSHTRNEAAELSENECYEKYNYKNLAHLPQGRILNHYEQGSHILLYSPHDVMSGPYHRNNSGNRLSLDVWFAQPTESADMLRRHHIDYIVLCPADISVVNLADVNKDGFLHALLGGQNMPFLEPLDQAGALRIWRVKN
jgi:hypothetical protein